MSSTHTHRGLSTCETKRGTRLGVRSPSRSETDKTSKECYKDKHLGQFWSRYVHDDVRFTGPSESPPYIFKEMTEMLDLFDKFFTKRTLRKIVTETNRYAASINPIAQCPRAPSDCRDSP